MKVHEINPFIFMWWPVLVIMLQYKFSSTCCICPIFIMCEMQCRYNHRHLQLYELYYLRIPTRIFICDHEKRCLQRQVLVYTIAYQYINVQHKCKTLYLCVTVQHILNLKNEMSQIGYDPTTFDIVSQHSTLSEVKPRGYPQMW